MESSIQQTDYVIYQPCGEELVEKKEELILYADR